MNDWLTEQRWLLHRFIGVFVSRLFGSFCLLFKELREELLIDSIEALQQEMCVNLTLVSQEQRLFMFKAEAARGWVQYRMLTVLYISNAFMHSFMYVYVYVYVYVYK